MTTHNLTIHPNDHSESCLVGRGEIDRYKLSLSKS